MARPNNLHWALDPVDRRIVDLLERNGRMANNAVAEAVGIAPSTCLGRVRGLVERGVIRGFHADVEPNAVGRNIQAVIAVSLQPHARGAISRFARELAALHEVRNVYFVAGSHDFLVHVAMPDTEGLRSFVVDRLSGNPDVAVTETNLVFEHLRGEDRSEELGE